MTTIGRRKGVRRYGTAHGLRLSETMDFVCREYAKTVGVSLSDGLRLLLEQAIGQRVNAVEEQAARLGRIEEGVGILLGRTEEILAWGDPPATDPSGYAPMSDEEIERAVPRSIPERQDQLRDLLEKMARIIRGVSLPGEFDEPDDMAALAEDTPGYGDLLREYYEGSGWE